MGVRHHTLTHCLSTSLPLATAQVLKTSIMASRSVAVAGSRSAAAAESSSMVSARKTTKTYTTKTDASGNVSTEVHTHVDSASDQSSAQMRRMEERIRVIMEDLEAEQGLRNRIA